MIEMDFIDITEKMEKYYQEQYNAEQRKFIYDAVKNMTKERYELLIQKAIKSCKYLPKVANLLEIEQGLPREEIKQKEKVKCKICGGSGIVPYIKKIKNGDTEIPYQYVARCICENGKEYGQAIPSIVEVGLVKR